MDRRLTDQFAIRRGLCENPSLLPRFKTALLLEGPDADKMHYAARLVFRSPDYPRFLRHYAEVLNKLRPETDIHDVVTHVLREREADVFYMLLRYTFGEDYFSIMPTSMPGVPSKRLSSRKLSQVLKQVKMPAAQLKQILQEGVLECLWMDSPYMDGPLLKHISWLAWNRRNSAQYMGYCLMAIFDISDEEEAKRALMA